MTPWHPGDLERLRPPRFRAVFRELREFVAWLGHGTGDAEPRGTSRSVSTTIPAAWAAGSEHER